MNHLPTCGGLDMCDLADEDVAAVLDVMTNVRCAACLCRAIKIGELARTRLGQVYASSTPVA